MWELDAHSLTGSQAARLGQATLGGGDIYGEKGKGARKMRVWSPGTGIVSLGRLG